MQTVNEAKVKAALKATGDDATQEKLDALICLAVNQEKLELQDQYAKEVRNFFLCVLNLIYTSWIDFYLQKNIKFKNNILKDVLCIIRELYTRDVLSHRIFTFMYSTIEQC